MGLLRSAACSRSISGVTPFGSFSKISIDGLAATIAGGSRLGGAIDGGGAVGGGLEGRAGLALCGGVAFAGVLGGLAGRGAGRETICCTCAEIDLGPDENGITVGAAGIVGRGGAASGAAALRTAGAALRA